MPLIRKKIHDGDQFKSIAKQAPWYLASSMVMRATSFLLLPVYTRYLAPEDYGTLGILESVLQILPLLFSISIDRGFSRFFHDRKHDEESVRVLFSTHFWFVAAWGTIVAFVFLLTHQLTVQQFVSIPFVPVVILIAIIPLFNQLAAMGLQLLRVNLHARSVSMIQIASFALHTGVSVFTLVYLDLGYESKIWGMLGAASVSFSTTLFVAIRFKLLGFRFDLGQVKESLIYSAPLVPAIGANWINVASDKLILAKYKTLSDVGLYSIAVQMVFAVRMFQDAVTLVQSQISLSAFVDNVETGKQKIREFIKYYFWMMATIYFLFAIWIREMLYILTEERYHGAYRVVWILAVTPVFAGFHRIFMPVLRYHKRTGLISAAAILGAIANASLNILLIPLYGREAAAWTTLITGLIYAGWIVGNAQRIEYTRLDHRLVTIPTLFVALCLVPVILLDGYYQAFDPEFFALKVMLTLTYLGCNMIYPGTRPTMMAFVRAIRNRLPTR